MNSSISSSKIAEHLPSVRSYTQESGPLIGTQCPNTEWEESNDAHTLSFYSIETQKTRKIFRRYSFATLIITQKPPFINWLRHSVPELMHMEDIGLIPRASSIRTYTYYTSETSKSGNFSRLVGFLLTLDGLSSRITDMDTSAQPLQVII